MRLLRFGFDYPITRRYPWRLATSGIVVASAIFFTGLFYFSLAVVGLTSTPFFQTTYETPQDPSWTNRMNIKKSLNRTLGCDPTTLGSGGLYKTRNGVFAYTVQTMVSKDTGEEFSTLAYDGSVLENCAVDYLGSTIDYGGGSAVFEATINCTLSGIIELISTAATTVYSRQTNLHKNHASRIRKETRETHMARATNRVLNGFMDDIIYQFSTSPHTNMYCFSIFEPGPRYFTHVEDCIGDRTNGENQPMRFALNNFAQVLQSAVLLDLGTTSPANVLTNPELMHYSLHTNLNPLQASESNWFNGTGVDNILSNIAGYNLPLDNPQPVPFNTRYLCHRMWWKTPTNLTVDVLVATSSLFTVYWALLNLALRYFASRSSPSGNYCACPNCDELPHHTPTSTSFLMQKLHSADDGPDYKSLFTRSQSTL